MKRRDFLRNSATLAGAMLPAVAFGDSRPCPPGTFGVQQGGSTSTGCGPVAPGSAPVWFLDLPERTWQEVAGGSGRTDIPLERRGERLLDVAVRPASGSSVGMAGNGWNPTSAWTGGAVDQSRREYILAANGGHGDGMDNGVYLCRIGDATPRWYRVMDPTPDQYLVSQYWPYNEPAVYKDGRPVSVHGWHKQCFGNGRVWHVGQDSTAGPSSFTGAIVSWNRDHAGEDPALWPIVHTAQDRGGWDVHGVLLPDRAGPPDGSCGPSCYDRVGNKIWGFSETTDNPRYWSVDATNGASTRYAASLGSTVSFGACWAACAHDVNRPGEPGVIVVNALSQTRQSVYVLDLRDPGRGLVERPTTPGLSWGDGTENSLAGYKFQPRYGAIYHAPSRAILAYDPSYGLGGSIRKLNIPADPISGNYVWETVAPAPETVRVAYPSTWRGAYSKFNLVEDMGNGQAALVLVTDVLGPLYVYRLPAGGL